MLVPTAVSTPALSDRTRDVELCRCAGASAWTCFSQVLDLAGSLDLDRLLQVLFFVVGRTGEATRFGGAVPVHSCKHLFAGCPSSVAIMYFYLPVTKT